MPTFPDDGPHPARDPEGSPGAGSPGGRPPPGSAPSRRPDGYLVADDVTSGYQKVPVIRDMSIQVALGEIVVVMGPNGAGKSTLVKAVTGKLPLFRGTITLAGEDISRMKEDQRALRGIGYVPQSGDVFPTLTVLENLEMGGYRLSRQAVRPRLEEIFEVFPSLRPLRRRLARALSGGERKTLGIARALVAEPRVLILDEPTSNLAPALASKVLHEVVGPLAATGRAVLLIEQRVHLGLEVASWGYVLSDGRMRLAASAEDLRRHGDIGSLFLAASGEGRKEVPGPFQP